MFTLSYLSLILRVSVHINGKKTVSTLKDEIMQMNVFSCFLSAVAWLSGFYL